MDALLEGTILIQLFRPRLKTKHYFIVDWHLIGGRP